MGVLGFRPGSNKPNFGMPLDLAVVWLYANFGQPRNNCSGQPQSTQKRALHQAAPIWPSLQVLQKEDYQFSNASSYQIMYLI